MKLTVLSKCFGKMKRVALTLFAVLCVGSVWGADWPGDLYIGESTCGFDIDTKTLSFSRDFCAIVKGTYSIICSYSYESNGQTYSGSERVEKDIAADEVFQAKNELWPTLTKNLVLSEFSLGDVVTATVKFQRKTAAGGWEDFTTFGEHDNELTYVFDTRGVLTSECYWDVDSKKFKVSGKTSGGEDIKGVKIKYVVGNAAVTSLPANAETAQDVTYNTATGEYEAFMPYVNERSVLSWSVYALFDEDSENSEKIYTDPSSQLTVLSEEQGKGGYITYTWVGNSNDNLWSSPQNWEEDKKQSLKGVPGYVNNSGYYTSTACFTNSATVNLNGGSFRLWDYEGNNVFPRGLEFAKPTDEDEMKVSFTNGRLQMFNGGSGHSNPLLGGNGITVEFANNGIYDYSGNLAFAPGTTIIFSGDSTQPWKYNPANKGTGATTFVVKDGTVISSYGAESVSSTHTAIIQNGTWVITQPVSKGIANVTKFVDGTSQARLALGDNATSFKTKTLMLTGTFEFTFSENQNSKSAYILPNQLVDGSQNATFKVDATAYKSGAKVPMVEASTATTFIPKLQVFANGEDVTSDRNAKLVWEGTTLYFQQDSLNAASIGTAEYATLGAAVEAATSGATITVLNDCTADTACVIANKTVTIDLNGKTVKANDTAAATDGNGVFWVQAGGELTLNDSSEAKTGTVDGNGGNDYKMAIWADGGKVVINAGNYVNDNDGTHTQYDLIYAKNGGEIVINGGTFKCDTPRWTLNSHNTKTGTFVVTGGKFYQYNPTDFDTDEAVTTWCDAKYRAEADGEWYVIKEGYIVTTEPEASAVTVTADTEAEALAQVDFSVTTPEGVDAAAYKNYFKLVATETAVGSKTWIVALALKDELKPVIAETTPAITFNEDGTVTVNIENELPGLNYGVRYATTVEAVETTAPVAGFTVTPAAGDTAGFFKVVVDFKSIGETKTN